MRATRSRRLSGDGVITVFLSLLGFAKQLNRAACIHERQVVTESFPPPDDFFAFLTRFADNLDVFVRSPARDVAVLAFAEYAIEQTSRAEQSNVTPMQRRQRSSSVDFFFWKKELRNLLVCG